MGRGKKKGGDGEYIESLYDLSRCNSEDFDAVTGSGGHHGACGGGDSHQGGRSHHGNGRTHGGGAYESGDVIFLMERHLVPVDVVQAGMTRFSFLLETSAPGTMPDPLLIAALLDLVS